MTPGLVNFVCPQGSTFRRTLTYTLDSVPIDLSGYSSRLQVRQAYYSTEPLLSLVSGSGITVGGSAGTIDIYISNSDTSDLPPGSHVYDLEIISPSLDVDRLIEGTFIVTPEVTR
jgi:hypothetical protein